ncbi:hypothetical protein TVAG_054540 [Trichomonas vaginalis G3]|uniref:Uncharacterized protein n=1 Tax=Trichomonas vaginalis (strain ATCC PRA-98 / G3) TaxID=412133 RepID=A2EYC9_TRIV3|nr:spectrin binding [Trichomonas vaginalis G3]EAY02356.1 hypothetical protein TVAG_054540 [Trichomonas vaginalis G3]KAI5514032.1 spectrin binding [Trichomonas vaginalis G3]|eukprot:XP_001330623.1 hypothetical protein [Trichomonas vaginalis G3]
MNKTDSQGQTPLHILVNQHNLSPSQQDKAFQICDMLIVKGAKIDAKDKAGKTPYDYIRKKDYPDLKKRLRNQ